MILSGVKRKLTVNRILLSTGAIPLCSKGQVFLKNVLTLIECTSDQRTGSAASDGYELILK